MLRFEKNVGDEFGSRLKYIADFEPTLTYNQQHRFRFTLHSWGYKKNQETASPTTIDLWTGFRFWPTIIGFWPNMNLSKIMWKWQNTYQHFYVCVASWWWEMKQQTWYCSMRSIVKACLDQVRYKNIMIKFYRFGRFYRYPFWWRLGESTVT